MDIHEKLRRSHFFGRLVESMSSRQDLHCIVVTHLRNDAPVFLEAVARLGRICSVLPKPKSVDPAVLSGLRDWLTPANVHNLSRKRFSDPEAVLAHVEDCAAGKDVILLDVGGYFAAALSMLCARFSGRIVGVVEDTENGHQRYAHAEPLPCPVYSVARSPLKSSEDYLVGQSVAFGAESLIRTCGDIVAGRDVSVLGYGKIGSSAAQALRAKGARVTVVDTDAVRLTHAMSHGFEVAIHHRATLGNAHLVVCATGNAALRSEDLPLLKNGAYVASVTSADDELNLPELDKLYQSEAVTPHVRRYSTLGHYFYLLNEGNAVNFLYAGGVGSFIHLVQGEILAAMAELALHQAPRGLHEVTTETRRVIATTWLAALYEPGKE